MNFYDLNKTTQELIDFENEIAKSFSKGEVKGPAHFSRGNETQLIKIFRGLNIKKDCIKSSEVELLGEEHVINKKLIEIPDCIEKKFPLFNKINKDDWLFLSYRNHYHLLLRGVPKETVKRDILEGRSMHPLNKDYKIITSAIVPGQISIATGYAYALKRKNEFKKRVWAFCGDMASETGVYEECRKFAEGKNLPITFVIENNGISCETPTKEAWGLEKKLFRNLKSNEIQYYYKNNFPHQGVGKEAGF